MIESLMIWWAAKRGLVYVSKADSFIKHVSFQSQVYLQPIPRECVEKDFAYVMADQKRKFERLFQ